MRSRLLWRRIVDQSQHHHLRLARTNRQRRRLAFLIGNLVYQSMQADVIVQLAERPQRRACRAEISALSGSTSASSPAAGFPIGFPADATGQITVDYKRTASALPFRASRCSAKWRQSSPRSAEEMTELRPRKRRGRHQHRIPARSCAAPHRHELPGRPGFWVTVACCKAITQVARATPSIEEFVARRAGASRRIRKARRSRLLRLAAHRPWSSGPAGQDAAR